MAFHDSSGFTINDGRFTNANTIYNNHTVHKNISVVKVTKERQERQSIWDDYNRVKPGDMRIEENISTTSVRRKYNNWDEGLRKQYELWRDVDARRNIGIARLRGEDSEDKFLCVTYDGPDAFKAFQQDFNEFAHVKKANIAQIFGYNDNEQGLPALVFYDALIPLGRIVRDGHQRYLPLLYSYFATQFGRMQRELSVGYLLLGELWVDPRNGALQKGPYLELPLYKSVLMLGTTGPNTHSTHLPIQTYSNNDTVFEYLTRTFPARTILTGIHCASFGFFQPLVNEQVIPVLSSLPGAIYDWRSRDIIARLPGARERSQYELWRVLGRIPDGMRESRVVMDDGSVRFTVTSAEMQDLQEIELQYALYSLEERFNLLESWLAQAHSVFSQLGIHEDDWEDYSVLDHFHLLLERTSPPMEPNIPQNVYLFVRPVPCPSDDEAIWRSWLEGEKYFWSFDPFGREIVPERVRAHFGLPYFASTIYSFDYGWFPSHYDAVQKLHTSEGFDSTTTNFALSLGLPILEVVGDESRFEDFEDSSSDTSSQAGGNLELRSESSTRASSAKKPRVATRTSQPTRTSSRLQQLRTRKPAINSPGKPQDLGKLANRRKDAQAILSNRGATTADQGRRSNRNALGRRSTSMFSRGTSRPNKDLEESSPETLSLADDHPEAQAGPSTGAPKATKGRYYLRHRETRSFAVSNDTNAISPVTGLRPLTSRKRKRVGDTDNASRKKSPQVEYRQNERKRRHPSEPDSGRPNKRRRRPW